MELWRFKKLMLCLNIVKCNGFLVLILEEDNLNAGFHQLAHIRPDSTFLLYRNLNSKLYVFCCIEKSHTIIIIL